MYLVKPECHVNMRMCTRSSCDAHANEASRVRVLCVPGKRLTRVSGWLSSHISFVILLHPAKRWTWLEHIPQVVVLMIEAHTAHVRPSIRSCDVEAMVLH